MLMSTLVHPRTHVEFAQGVTQAFNRSFVANVVSYGFTPDVAESAILPTADFGTQLAPGMLHVWPAQLQRFAISRPSLQLQLQYEKSLRDTFAHQLAGDVSSDQK